MIRHVLFDADGVLQTRPGGWVGPLRPLLGERSEAFLADVMGAEEAGLHGREDFVAVLGSIMAAYGLSGAPADLYAELWLEIGVDEAMLALVHELRAAGLGVHLGTNQQWPRAAYMRESLGYDQLFDESFYSCELGIAKPAPGFFLAAVSTIGAAAGEVLFVDDLAVNVAGAQAAGLAAEQWTLADGLGVLRERLEGHGILAC
ncbi:HAD-superfamily hydrolase, subfamily IA, variant 3 [metagenome]|uniref:HAD-superfamily hydrolase, subfamily IA, variant 3 n=1 Tax=metagenome TaxID=256318 RepID=A0A2P2BZC6_9ZZZZ